ncbi:hypothetical protein FOA52_007554 [Chlamydomonas sp. UWO 241]|nr:hypothetical protein FOA52_007554 [Chlamydomonas sp. UWO 241]
MRRCPHRAGQCHAARPQPSRVHATLHGHASTDSCTNTGGGGGASEPDVSQPLLSRRGVLIGSAALPAAATAATLWLPQAARADPSTTTGSLGFEDRVSEFTLPSGLHFILLRRPEAPVVSMVVHANIGAFDEVDGQTGLAHLLEHMAFKGTSEIGSRDWKNERQVLAAMDEAFYELRAAQDAGATADGRRVQRLEAELKELEAKAASLSIPNAFGSMLTQQGGSGLNASTSQDETLYFVSLPSNKLELWFALEARRWLDPVFRELYTEKRVVAEERKMRLEASPIGRFQQAYAEASLSNNYRRPVIGVAGDVDRMGRHEVDDFFRKNYGPKNLTVSIVGDATPEQVHTLAERYFGDWRPEGYSPLPSGRALKAAVAAEPLPRMAAAAAMAAAAGMGGGGSAGGRGVVGGGGGGGGLGLLRDASDAGPLAMLGFYRPSLLSDDGSALQVVCDLLAGGRTSRLVSDLVLKNRSLLAVSAEAGYGGEKHAGLALVYARPANGTSPESANTILRTELDRFLQGGPTSTELARVKKSSATGLYSVLQSNSGMANVLASYHASTGSWRGVLEEIAKVDAISADECTSVARKFLSGNNCFRGYAEAPAGRGGAPAALGA